MMDKAATGASGPDLVLSVVVPIYNEADNIGPFLQRLERALDGLDGGYARRQPRQRQRRQEAGLLQSF